MEPTIDEYIRDLRRRLELATLKAREAELEVEKQNEYAIMIERRLSEVEGIMGEEDIDEDTLMDDFPITEDEENVIKLDDFRR